VEVGPHNPDVVGVAGGGPKGDRFSGEAAVAGFLCEKDRGEGEGRVGSERVGERFEAVRARGALGACSKDPHPSPIAHHITQT
jgi:hypothetical protein